MLIKALGGSAVAILDFPLRIQYQYFILDQHHMDYMHLNDYFFSVRKAVEKWFY